MATEISVANKIIADFMSETISDCGQYLVGGRVGTSVDPSAHYLEKLYSQSFDALIPVWEKLWQLGFSDFEFYPHADGYAFCMLGIDKPKYSEIGSDGETITEAAAKAAAKAICSITH
jgi:hypothetical protein